MTVARILVVDDDNQICDSIKDILESAGHDVVSSGNGAEALTMLEKGRFDLALLDIVVPKIDGYHLATHIAGLAHPPAIVFVSSRDYDQDEKVVESLGAAAFIRKPFQKRELLRVVSNLLSQDKSS